MDGPLPADWWATLKKASQSKAVDAGDPAWFGTWFASYMLTNAIFRIAAAAEKTCYLAGSLGKPSREALWKAVRDPASTLNTRVPSARSSLGQMPKSRPQRSRRLERVRGAFRRSNKVPVPLMFAFIQTDIDKHVAYKPAKELSFDRALAIRSFLETCELWREAAAWHTTTSS